MTPIPFSLTVDTRQPWPQPCSRWMSHTRANSSTFQKMRNSNKQHKGA
jgi:hypothetical protein